MSLLRANNNLYDGYGNPIKSNLGALNVTLSDTNFSIVNTFFKRQAGIPTTLAANSAVGATSLNLVSAAGVFVGHQLDIYDGEDEKVFPTVNSIAGNIVTLDKPLDNAYTAGDSVDDIIVNMNLVGTLAAPQSFKVKPLPGEEIDFTRILIEMTHGGAGDNGLFGDLTELSNGVVLRVYKGATNKFQSLTVWKTNSDIAVDMYDVSYTTRSGGGGSYGTNARGTFQKTGAVVRLNGDDGDYMEILIQDDLTGLASFRIKAQGSNTN